ncbi:SGPP, partial [Symbiodinium pilosum]
DEFFKNRIAGRQNKQICDDFFPDWDEQRAKAFADKKEAMFRERAAELLKPMTGLDRVRAWCDRSGIKKIAVTNAPRDNAELITDCIGYRSWFPELVIGDECERGKPDPCPYQTAMKRLGVRPECCIAFE